MLDALLKRFRFSQVSYVYGLCTYIYKHVYTYIHIYIHYIYHHISIKTLGLPYSPFSIYIFYLSIYLSVYLSIYLSIYVICTVYLSNGQGSKLKTCKQTQLLNMAIQFVDLPIKNGNYSIGMIYRFHGYIISHYIPIMFH